MGPPALPKGDNDGDALGLGLALGDGLTLRLAHWNCDSLATVVVPADEGDLALGLVNGAPSVKTQNTRPDQKDSDEPRIQRVGAWGGLGEGLGNGHVQRTKSLVSTPECSISCLPKQREPGNWSVHGHGATRCLRPAALKSMNW